MGARKLVVGERDVVLTPRVPPARAEQWFLSYLQKQGERFCKGEVLCFLSRLLNTSPVLSSSLCPPEPQMKAPESKELMSMEKLVHSPAAFSLRKHCCCCPKAFPSQSSSKVATMAAQL